MEFVAQPSARREPSSSSPRHGRIIFEPSATALDRVSQAALRLINSHKRDTERYVPPPQFIDKRPIPDPFAYFEAAGTPRCAGCAMPSPTCPTHLSNQCPHVLIGLRMLCALSLALLIAGCGGGDRATATDEPSLALAAVTPALVADKPAQILAVRRGNSNTSRKSRDLVVRAWGSLAGNVGPVMEVRVDGVALGRIEVRATTPTNYTFNSPTLAPGAKVDIAFVNDETFNREDRNLFVAYVTDGNQFITPSEPGVLYDGGVGEAAFDGVNTLPGQGGMYFSGALRMTWPANDRFALNERDIESSRFLQQATFGPTMSELAKLRTQTFPQWIDEQVALPVAADYFVSHIQSKYDQGPDYQPYNGSKYDPDWVGQRFWTGAATGADQLRRRMAFALHKIFVVSQADANLFWHSRTYATYLDSLHHQAFGNFRQLIEEVALSPTMGIYLSHMRNMKEDPATNRLPDENFARELMQLFTIGLHELNNDGTPKLDATGKPIETYGNQDVMNLAKVFTGWSWGYDDSQLTETAFRWGTPDLKLTGQARVDTRRMKPYRAMASTAEKRLFTGTPHALVIPANTSPTESVRMALNTLFKHPNVGPFLARQLIQQVVTSNPSPAYIGRVASVFNDNGRGIRGDLGAVIRAVLLDTEARTTPTAHTFGKVREPILRVTHWMRAFGARSLSGQFQLTNELAAMGQHPNRMPSVFSFFRPGYAPPLGASAASELGAPEMQIINESTLAAWANRLEIMLREGMGWEGNLLDVTASFEDEATLVAASPAALLSRLNTLLFAGQMSPEMKSALMNAMQGVPEGIENRNAALVRVGVFVAMSSPEYLVQR